MHHYFLLTYSVENIGYSSDERIANAVRDSIAVLTLADINAMDTEISFAIDEWEKISIVETAISGQIWFSDDHAETGNSKKIFARKTLRSIFRNILHAKDASPVTTVINCAVIIDGAGETFTFKVLPRT